MKIHALALLAISSLSGSVLGQDRIFTGFPDLPKDAREVAERSIACQHFWGEGNGTGDERDRQVASALKELKCDQIVKDLDLIRVKYRKNQRVLTILKEAAID